MRVVTEEEGEVEIKDGKVKLEKVNAE